MYEVMMTNKINPDAMSREWNYHPELPLADPSLFKWPPDPRFLGRWIVRNWLTMSERVMMVFLATLCWWLLYPALEAAKRSANWVAAPLWSPRASAMAARPRAASREPGAASRMAS